MKKVILLSLIVLFLSSCQKSNEALIKSAFNEYVKNNFDDPNLIAEIVSILPKDTVSISTVKDHIIKSIAMDTFIDSLMNNDRFRITSRMERLIKRTHLYSYSDRIMAKIYIEKLMAIATEQITIRSERISLINKAYLLIDSLKPEAPKYGYEVKFRQKIGSELKINTYYGYIDSLSNKIYIKPKKWIAGDEDSSIQRKEMESFLTEYVASISKRLNIIKEEDKYLSKIEAL